MRSAALLAACCLAAPAAAQAPVDPFDSAVPAPRVALGPLVVAGEDHPAPRLEDFAVTVNPSSAPVRAAWIEGSVRWLRGKDGLALPRARLLVTASVPSGRALLRWRGAAVMLQDRGEEAAAELFVPLHEAGEAVLLVDGRPAARVRIAARAASAAPPGERHAIDHSCSPWKLRLEGVDDLYASANCRLVPVGRLGAEEALLDVRFSAAGATLADGSPAALAVALRDGRPARVSLVGPDGKPRAATLSASVPPRLNRMKLAWGAGPYHLSSSAQDGNGWGGSVMLYGNFRLRMEDSLSVRFFEAAVARDAARRAFFNNFGVYFAYDAAAVLDTRVRLTALLGMQSVTFAPHGLARRSYSEVIAPQGLELSYADAFGARGKSLSGGMFLLPTQERNYQNFWVRWGTGWFGELNYISWRSRGRDARMWGVSIGAPLARLF